MPGRGRWYQDPQIPRRPQSDQQRRGVFPTTGWFVQQKDGVVILQDHRGRTWPLRFVQLCQGTWGAVDNSEGVSKLPRVREYDAEGAVTVAGDKLVIDALDGDPRRVIVRGGVRGLTESDFLPYNPARSGANPNRWATRLAPLDGTGQAAGFVDIEVCADDAASIVITLVDASTPPADGPPAGAKTTITLRDGQILLSKDGDTPTEAFILSTALFADLSSWVTALEEFMTTTSTATTAPQIAAAAALFLIDALASGLSVGLATGTPYSSTLIKGS